MTYGFTNNSKSEETSLKVILQMKIFSFGDAIKQQLYNICYSSEKTVFEYPASLLALPLFFRPGSSLQRAAVVALSLLLIAVFLISFKLKPTIDGFTTAEELSCTSAKMNPSCGLDGVSCKPFDEQE